MRIIKTEDIAKMIDHSLLKPELTKKDIVKGCQLAKNYDVASVCVRPADVNLAGDILRGTDVKVGTVIGFPLGFHKTSTKKFESEEALQDGAVEMDLVLNIGKLLSEEFEFVKNDIRTITVVAHSKDAIVKVILENCYLSKDFIRKACEIAEKAKADFVKTSTGFGSGGAQIADLKVMRDSVGEAVKLKAAGGVRSLDAALSVRAIGVERIGATATKEILEEARKKEINGTLKEKNINEIEELQNPY